jgi:hypothetical protein
MAISRHWLRVSGKKGPLSFFLKWSKSSDESVARAESLEKNPDLVS